MSPQECKFALLTYNFIVELMFKTLYTVFCFFTFKNYLHSKLLPLNFSENVTLKNIIYKSYLVYSYTSYWNWKMLKPKSHPFFDHGEHSGSMWPYALFDGLPFHNYSSENLEKFSDIF